MVVEIAVGPIHVHQKQYKIAMHEGRMVKFTKVNIKLSKSAISIATRKCRQRGEGISVL